MAPTVRLPPKAKKHKQGRAPLESVDDFQNAADAEEETGGKWRTGDPAKSCRAFLRAIELYNQGLSRHPRAFDLAYNKARLEFELSQQSALIIHLPATVSHVDFLRQALQSHKLALSLDRENTDILFNTAQLLLALAEVVDEDSDPDDTSKPSSWTREALELLDACFSRQTMLYEEQIAAWNEEDETMSAGMAVPPEAEPPNNSSPDSNMTEQSAIIQAAITPEDLLETAFSSVSALIQLLPLEPTAASAIASLATPLFTTKIPQTVALLPEPSQAEQHTALALAHANFAAALADAEYTNGTITAATYLSRLDLFHPLPRTAETLCDHADALTTFCASTLPATWASRPGAVPLATHRTILESVLNTYSEAATKLSTDQDTSLGKDADGALSVIPRVDVEREKRLGAIAEAEGDVHLLLVRVAETAAGDDDGASAQHRGGGGSGGGDSAVRSAVERYGHAEWKYGRASERRAADKVRVRGRVAQGMLLLSSSSSSVGPGRRFWEVVLRDGCDGVGRRVVSAMIDEGILGDEWGTLVTA